MDMDIVMDIVTKGPIASGPEPRVRLSRRDANHSDGPYQESWGHI